MTTVRNGDASGLSFLAFALATLCLALGGLMLKPWPRLAACVLVFSAVLFAAAFQFWRIPLWSIGMLVAGGATAVSIHRSIAFARRARL